MNDGWVMENNEGSGRWRYGKMKECNEMGRDGWFNGYGKWVYAWGA